MDRFDLHERISRLRDEILAHYVGVIPFHKDGTIVLDGTDVEKVAEHNRLIATIKWLEAAEDQLFWMMVEAWIREEPAVLAANAVTTHIVVPRAERMNDILHALRCSAAEFIRNHYPHNRPKAVYIETGNFGKKIYIELEAPFVGKAS